MKGFVSEETVEPGVIENKSQKFGKKQFDQGEINTKDLKFMFVLFNFARFHAKPICQRSNK